MLLQHPQRLGPDLSGTESAVAPLSSFYFSYLPHLAFLQENGIAYVKKEENPPSAPQIRPIENYWGILKMKVYERNWTAKNRESLIRRIKIKQKEIDQDIVIKLFDNLKGKVHIPQMKLDYIVF